MNRELNGCHGRPSVRGTPAQFPFFPVTVTGSLILVNHGNTLRPSARGQIENDAGAYLLECTVILDGEAVQDIPLSVRERGCGSLREHIQRFSIIGERQLKRTADPGKRERLYFDG